MYSMGVHAKAISNSVDFLVSLHHIYADRFFGEDTQSFKILYSIQEFPCFMYFVLPNGKKLIVHHRSTLSKGQFSKLPLHALTIMCPQKVQHTAALGKDAATYLSQL